MSGKGLYGNAVLVLAAAGCVPIFLVACYSFRYPAVSFVPGVNVETPLVEQVHAFRLDVTLAKRFDTVTIADESIAFREISVTSSGHVNGQPRLALDHSWNGWMDRGDEHHRVLLHLYRPGYQLVEIDAWQFKGNVTWKEAPDLDAKERAVDDLLSVRITALKEPATPYGRDGYLKLALGSQSEHQRKALLFAAAEYERLAASVSEDDIANLETHKRLAGKADKVRSWAEKDTWKDDSRPPLPNIPSAEN